MGCTKQDIEKENQLRLIHSKNRQKSLKIWGSYYPFGFRHNGYNQVVSPNGNSLAQQWKFGGKQIQEEMGLMWYDVTARNYDPAFRSMDEFGSFSRGHEKTFSV